MSTTTGHVFAVAGAKGGVGKTTTSINLGAVFADTGHSAVTVEMDLAMANLVDFLDVDVDVSSATTMHDVLAGTADPAAAVYETGTGLDILPSGTELAGYADTDLSNLPGVVEGLRARYDVVILDTPAGLSEETLRPLQLADETLLVSTPRVASIRNVRNTMELADRVGTDVRGLVLTKSGTGASPGADRIAEFLDVELLGHVPEDEAVPHAQDSGDPVVVNAPNSGAAHAYRKVAGKLRGEDDPGVEPDARTDESETTRTSATGEYRRTDGPVAETLGDRGQPPGAEVSAETDGGPSRTVSTAAGDAASGDRRRDGRREADDRDDGGFTWVGESSVATDDVVDDPPGTDDASGDGPSPSATAEAARDDPPPDAGRSEPGAHPSEKRRSDGERSDGEEAAAGNEATSLGARVRSLFGF
ncbi:P-loop NTPase [Haloarcula litorea]|uniref:P-loop NTPase n=1 Tax=Haloarcula litorea TaxID=3032579 RepID=UPI0023E8EAFE|nr:P-loop NTPase [Halomicroarcula sp. GDY20]